MSQEGDEFLHIKGDSNFQQRSCAVFSCLDALEPGHDTKNESAEEKRPPHCGIPDHVAHPERWEKYSLEDVNEAVGGLSGDALNRHIALSFIDDLKKRKEENEEDKVLDIEMKEKIVFSKDVIKHRMEVDEVTTPTVHGGVHVMPDYVVGQTPSRKSKKMVTVDSLYASQTSQQAAGGIVDLPHLKEAEPELEEENDVDSSKSGSLKTVEGEKQSDNLLFSKRKSRDPHNFRKRERKETDDMS